jgi:RimJ/RimL family protein N-acetyltransferase
LKENISITKIKLLFLLTIGFLEITVKLINQKNNSDSYLNVISMKEVLINTNRLVLRKLRLDDYSSFIKYRTDPQIMKYQSWDLEITENSYNKFIEEQNQIKYGTVNKWTQIGIENKNKRTLIGDCALHFFHEKQTEFGITISKEYQNKGYAYEALISLFNFCFNTLNVHRITGLVDVDNISSVTLQEKLGMRKEAHYKKSYFDKRMNEWRDEYRFAVLASEWNRYKE